MKYIEKENQIQVTLTSGEITVISKEDVVLLDQFSSWAIAGSVSKYVSLTRFVSTEYGNLQQTLYLHRAIAIRVFGFDKMVSWQVDHKDRNRLNNLRSNLRLATHSQNGANCRKTRSNTGFRGVTLVKRLKTKPYNAHCSGKNLGYFKTPIEAAKEYDKAAIKKYGSFAMLNFEENE